MDTALYSDSERKLKVYLYVVSLEKFSRGTVYIRMATPRDQQLYNRIKKRVQKQYGRWSAYASGSLVQQYKKAYQKKHGSTNAYTGSKSSTAPLTTWFRENWVDVKTGRPCGAVKTKRYYPTCRPRAQHMALSEKQRRGMIRRKQRAGSKTTSYRDIF
jgi:hypothetical protein